MMTKQEYIDAFRFSMESAIDILDRMTDEDFEVFYTIHGDAVPALVDMTGVHVDETYQRPLAEKRVQKAVKDYHPEGFQPISVGERESTGTLYTNDGQHRLSVAQHIAQIVRENNFSSDSEDNLDFIMAWKHLNSSLLSECTGFDYKNRCSARPAQATQWRTMHIQVAKEWEGVTDAHIAVYNITNMFIRNGFGLGMVRPVHPNTVIDRSVVNLEEGVHYQYIDSTNNNCTSSIYQSIYNIKRVLLNAIYNKGNASEREENRALAMSILDMSLKVIAQLEKKPLRMSPRILAGLIQFFYENRKNWNPAQHSSDSAKIDAIVELFNHYTLDEFFNAAVKRNKINYSLYMR